MGAFGGETRGRADRANRKPGQSFQNISTIHFELSLMS